MGKKLIAVMVCILMLPACSAVAHEPDSRFIGDWYVHTFRIDESSYGTGDAGMIIKVSVEADGGVTWTDPDGSLETGTWTSEGDSMLISWDEGGFIELLYADGALVSNPGEGSSLVVHLEGSLPEQTSDTTPEYRTNVRAADFDGNWISVSITAHGVTIPMGELGESVNPQIRNGKLVALKGKPVDSSVSTEFLSSTLFINNPATNVVSVMNLLADGAAIILHLQQPDAYFTLIPAP